MIKLIANITVERLETKAKPTSATPTSTTSADSASTAKPSIPKATPVSNGSNKPQPLVLKKPTRPIDLSEFKSRLQNAYRSPPTPKIAVSGQDGIVM